MMAGCGIETDHVTTSEEGVIRLSKKNYDGALINLNMPTISGMKLARMVMAKDPGTKTILVSEMGTIDDYIEAQSAGVSEFIYKSAKTSELVAIIERLLKLKGLREGYQFESGRRVSLNN